MTTRSSFGAVIAALIGGLAVLSLVALAREDPGATGRRESRRAALGKPSTFAGQSARGAAQPARGPDQPASPLANRGAVTATLRYVHTFEPTDAFPLAGDTVSWSEEVHQGASGVYSIRSPAEGQGATTPEWSFEAVNGPSSRHISVFAAEPARNRRAETVREADPPASLAAFVNLGLRPRETWSDTDRLLAPVQDLPWVESASVDRLASAGAVQPAGSDVILGEPATGWETDQLGDWGAFREARRRVWLTDDGFKIRVQAIDAEGEVFATDEATSLARGEMGDPEAHWRSSNLPVRFTRLSREIPAGAPGQDLADRAAGAGIPVSATLYVTGTPNSGQLEVVEPVASWAVVYVPADEDFALVVAPEDRAPPMWWVFWPGVRQAARSPLVAADSAGWELPQDAGAYEYPDGNGAMVTWVEGTNRIALLALDTVVAMQTAQLLAGTR